MGCLLFFYLYFFILFYLGGVGRGEHPGAGKKWIEKEGEVKMIGGERGRRGKGGKFR